MWDWDENKRQATLLHRGVDFAIVEEMDLDLAEISRDTRRDYGEVRLQAIADGMQTMYENGLSKAVAGVTTIEEVLRVTREE